MIWVRYGGFPSGSGYYQGQQQQNHVTPETSTIDWLLELERIAEVSMMRLIMAIKDHVLIKAQTKLVLLFTGMPTEVLLDKVSKL